MRQPNKPKNNSTNSNANGVTKPTPTASKPNPPKPEKRIQICPAKWSLEHWKDFIVNAFNWEDMFKDLVDIYKNGFKIIDSGMITNYAKEHTILGVQMNIKGVQKTVKDLAGLSSGTRTTLGQIVKTTFGGQMKIAFSEKGGLLGILVSIGIDIATAAIKGIVGLISFSRFVIDSVVSLVYNVLQTLAVTAIRALLTPFIGPFAWVLGLIIDVGLTWIEWFIDLKAKIGDFVEWILNSDFGNAIKMVIEVSKKL